MQGTDHSSLLRRKLGGAPPSPGAARGAARPEVDAMRAAARAAHTAAGLKVEMRASAMEPLGGLTDLIAAVESAMLIVPFSAPDGAEGYVALSHEFAQSLIEKATTGTLSPLAVEPRQASSIDMLLCRDFLRRFLDAWREVSEGKLTLDWLSGYEPQAEPVVPDLMALNSRDVPYTLFRVEMRLDAQRDAQILTAFPAERFPRQQLRSDPPAEPDADWGKIWRDAVMDTRAELDAELIRLTLSLAEVRQWAPGDQVRIPTSALREVTLGRRCGVFVATGRLGQAQGHRALRLNTLSKDANSAALPTENAANFHEDAAFDAAEFPPQLPAQPEPADTPDADTPDIDGPDANTPAGERTSQAEAPSQAPVDGEAPQNVLP